MVRYVELPADVPFCPYRGRLPTRFLFFSSLSSPPLRGKEKIPKIDPKLGGDRHPQSYGFIQDARNRDRRRHTQLHHLQAAPGIYAAPPQL